MTKFKEEWIPTILEMIEQGYLKKEIANFFGISKSTYEYAARKYGFNNIKTKDRRFVRVPIEELEKAYYQEGKTLVEIAQKYGVTESTVRYQLRKMSKGTKADNKKYKLSLQECKKLYEQGLGLETISEKSGYPMTTLRRRLKEMGVEIRNPLDAHKNVLYERNGEKFYFRSTWEVFVASFLDSNNKKWKYEEITFNLGDCKYTPDFVVYDDKGNIEMIIEVKGQFNDYCIRKMMLFEILYPEIEYQVWEQEVIRKIMKEVA